MSFFDDVWGAVKGVTGGAVDVAGDVFDALPVSGPIKDLVNGPLRDFARTPFGATVLRSIATAITGPFAAIVGPQLASVAWSIPGLLRGESFDDAWMLEFKWRVEKTAETLGPGIADTFSAELKGALDQLSGMYGVGELVELTAEQLAKRLGIRVDVAEYALSLWNRATPPPRDAFEPQTGRRYSYSERAINRGSVVESFTDARGSRTSALAQLFAAPEPAIASSGSTATRTPARRSSTTSDLVLAGTIVAAAAALVWWHREETRKRR